MATELEVVDEETGELLPATIDDPGRVVSLLAGLAEMEQTDASEITAAQLRRIMFADEEADAFAEVPTFSSDDLIDRPFEVTDARLLPSKYNKGRGAFVAADIVLLDTGEQAILTTSAARPAARICWLKMHGKLPRQCVVTVITEETANGHKVLGLELVG